MTLISHAPPATDGQPTAATRGKHPKNTTRRRTVTPDIIILILTDPGFAIGWLGEAANHIVNGAPL